MRNRYLSLLSCLVATSTAMAGGMSSTDSSSPSYTAFVAASTGYGAFDFDELRSSGLDSNYAGASLPIGGELGVNFAQSNDFNVSASIFGDWFLSTAHETTGRTSGNRNYNVNSLWGVKVTPAINVSNVNLGLDLGYVSFNSDYELEGIYNNQGVKQSGWLVGVQAMVPLNKQLSFTLASSYVSASSKTFTGSNAVDYKVTPNLLLAKVGLQYNFNV